MKKQFTTQAYEPGTGESLCRTPSHIRVTRTNTPISKADAHMFALFIDFEFTLIWGSECKRNCGWACSRTNTIKLNRQDVGTYLHELAHLIADKIGSKGHDQKFAFVLDTMHDKWTEYTKIKEG